MFRNNDVSDGGRPILIAAPTIEVISREACKAALGISDTSRDTVIDTALAATAATLDPAANGWLGRALRPQQWELQLRSFNDVRPDLRRGRQSNFCGNWAGQQGFAAQSIPLPYPPLIAVDSVKYLDVNGVNTTLALGSGYRIIGMGDTFKRQAIAPPYGGSWPSVRIDDASVRIRYTCGYLPANSGPPVVPDQMPPQIIQAVCLGVRALLGLATRDIMLAEDRVDGIGTKKYQNNPAVAEIITQVIGGLLNNHAVS